MARFLIRQVPTGVKFDLLADNGQAVASSEVYRTESACRKGVQSIRKNAPLASVEDQTVEDGRGVTNPKFEVYIDKAGQYRFRLKSANGRVIAVSEGYQSKAACLHGTESVRRCAATAEE